MYDKLVRNNKFNDIIIGIVLNKHEVYKAEFTLKEAKISFQSLMIFFSTKLCHNQESCIDAIERDVMFGHQCMIIQGVIKVISVCKEWYQVVKHNYIYLPI